MDAALREELLNKTRAALEAGDWPAVVRQWEPWAEAGDAEGAYQLAYHHFWYGPAEEEAEDERMMALLRGAAAQGHAEAMWLLLRQEGRPTQRDAGFVGLLRRAGEMGSAHAQRELGVLYATGDWAGGLDEAEAARWYRLAAGQGDAESQYDLGLMLLLGEGGRKDAEEGLEWLERAGTQGHGAAMRVLADCYGDGQLGAAEDAGKAAVWRERLAEYERLNPPGECRRYVVEGANGEADFRWLLGVGGVTGYSVTEGGGELAVGYEPDVISKAELDERVLSAGFRGRVLE